MRAYSKGPSWIDPHTYANLDLYVFSQRVRATSAVNGLHRPDPKS
jgi:hypothetical protein